MNASMSPRPDPNGDTQRRQIDEPTPAGTGTPLPRRVPLAWPQLVQRRPATPVPAEPTDPAGLQGVRDGLAAVAKDLAAAAEQLTAPPASGPAPGEAVASKPGGAGGEAGEGEAAGAMTDGAETTHVVFEEDARIHRWVVPVLAVVGVVALAAVVVNMSGAFTGPARAPRAVEAQPDDGSWNTEPGGVAPGDPAASRVPGGSGRPGASSAPGSPAAGEPPATGASGTPSQPGGPIGAPPSEPRPALLRARYTTVARTQPPGYRGQVVISNAGAVRAVGWRVTFHIGKGDKIVASEGADFQVSDSLVTFTPRNGIREVPPAGDVRFTFEVRGGHADEPTDCRLDGTPCG